MVKMQPFFVELPSHGCSHLLHFFLFASAFTAVCNTSMTCIVLWMNGNRMLGKNKENRRERTGDGE